MTYYLITYPNCKTCREIKDYLKEKNIDYDEIQPIDRDGKKAWGKLYPKLINPLEKDDKGIISPILIEINDSNFLIESSLEKIAQGEDIKNLF